MGIVAEPIWLNTAGLLLGIIGVFMVFIWGPPQPEHSTGKSLGIEGPMVDDYDRKVIKRKAFYTRMSRLGLFMIMTGFALQIWALWLPHKQAPGTKTSEAVNVGQTMGQTEKPGIRQ